MVDDAQMPIERPTCQFAPDQLDEVLEFLKQMRGQFRTLRFVQVWPKRLEVYDVNQDSFAIIGLGYLQPEIVIVLDKLNAAFKRETIHEPTSLPYKEFKTGRRLAWAEDRVM